MVSLVSSDVNQSALCDLSQTYVHSVDSNSIYVPAITVRRSTRDHKTPSYLSDYKCNAVVLNRWCNLVFTPTSSYTKCEISEPKSYKEATLSPVWVAAM